MKKFITIFSFILPVFIQCNSHGSNQHSKGSLTETAQLDTSEVIINLRKWYSEINSCQVKYRKIVKALMGQSSEGGELTGYFENDSLKKIAAIYFGDMGKSITEYYFKNNKLFFVFTIDSLYDKLFYMEGYKISTIEENRYYFFNDTLIRWLGKDKKSVFVGLPEKGFRINQEVINHRKILEEP